MKLAIRLFAFREIPEICLQIARTAIIVYPAAGLVRTSRRIPADEFRLPQSNVMRNFLLILFFVCVAQSNAGAAIITIVDTISSANMKSNLTLAASTGLGAGSSFSTGIVGTGAYLHSIEILGATSGTSGPFRLGFFNDSDTDPSTYGIVGSPVFSNNDVAPSLSPSSLVTFTFSPNAAVLSDTSFYTFVFANGSGTATFQPAGVQVVSGDPYLGGVAFSNGTAVAGSDIAMRINVFATAIPEPTSFGLLALGAVGFVVRRRRARRIAKAVA